MRRLLGALCCSVAVLCCSLRAAGAASHFADEAEATAVAEAPAQELEQDARFEVIYGVRTRLPVRGVQQVAIENPELLSWELQAGEVHVLGRKKGQTLIYLKTETGLQLLVLEVKEGSLPVYTRRRRGPFLHKSADSLSGFWGLQANLPLADSPQLPALQQRFLSEWPLGQAGQLDGQRRLLARGSLIEQWQPGFSSFQQLSLPFVQLAYQDPQNLVNLGDSALYNPLSLLYPRLSQLKGLQVSHATSRYRLQLFSGLEAQPLALFQPAGMAPWQGYLNGGSGRWQTRLHPEADWGLLTLDGMLLSRLALQAQDVVSPPDAKPGQSAAGAHSGLLATGLEWQFKEQIRLQLALGSNLQGLGLMSQLFYRHLWPEQRDWLNMSGLYRHFGRGYLQSSLQQQDLFNLRLNSHFATGVSFAGSSGVRLLDGQLQDYQLSLRLGQDFWTQTAQLYGQFNSWMLQASHFRHVLTLGGLWRQDLPLSASYSWLLNQAPDQPDRQGHRLQVQARLWQNADWQLALYEQALAQDLGTPDFQLNQALRLTLSTSLADNWLLRSYLGHHLQLQTEQAARQLWQSGLLLDWWPHPLHQLQVGLDYQYAPADELHLLGVMAGYTWRFGYRVEFLQADLQGRVFEDLNQNGQPDPEEPGLAGVQLQVRDLQVETDSQGQFVFKHLPLRDYQLLLNSASLPAGYQVTSENPLPVSLKAPATEVAVAVRSQMGIQGLIFASPLLARGLDQIELELDGEQRTLSQYGGRFYFLTTPGEHHLRLNPLTVPEGYRLRGPLSRQLDSTHNLQVQFVFDPLISLELTLLNAADRRPLIQHTLRAVSGLEPEREELAQTDAAGQLSLDNLLPGSTTLEVAGFQPVEIELPDQPGQYQRTLLLTPAAGG